MSNNTFDNNLDSMYRKVIGYVMDGIAGEEGFREHDGKIWRGEDVLLAFIVDQGKKTWLMRIGWWGLRSFCTTPIA